ncbi:hypothetical protein [Gordonia hydrophobica]|uniref:DUF3592 domain-containing protein n=1 Tax=Gordonia hydrophobica TaxID=40516 RepID=A0ABZ2U3C0_9ACTN|nr:hypothetical protein [Gordonia hydrophobica]MBM7367788.1 putative membrane protein YhdT [Gordonia hydrophobica]
MSLVNPESRWWNRDSTRRISGCLFYIVSVVLAFVGSVSMGMQGTSPLPLWASLVGNFLPIPLIVLGTFLVSFGTVGGFDSRLFVWAMAMYFIAIGTGSLIGGTQASNPSSGDVVTAVMFGLMIGGGVAAILIYEALRLRSTRKAALRAIVERDGTVVNGVVTRARPYSVNYQQVTRVTVQFTDAEGQTRWSSASIGGAVSKGQSVKVTFSQQHLGRRGAVILS